MPLKIIIIDDEECIRDSLRWYLEDLGHQVLTAAEPLACDIYHGHECVQKEPCADALIIDYKMPEMNGLEFIELLHDRGCKGMTSNMLLITGNTGDLNLEKVKALNCQYLQKPLSYAMLDGWLSSVMNSQKDHIFSAGSGQESS